MKMRCINCGEVCEFTHSNLCDKHRPTSGRCSACGKIQLLKPKKNKKKRKNIFVKSQSVADIKASDKLKVENDPTIQPINKKRFNPRDIHNETNDKSKDVVRGVSSMTNPFTKEAAPLSGRYNELDYPEKMPFPKAKTAWGIGSEDGSNKSPQEAKLIAEYPEEFLDGCLDAIEKKINLDKGQQVHMFAKKNPFVKSSAKTDDKLKDFSLADRFDELLDFSPKDRLEYRKSPTGADIVPGYKEWEDREVDHCYDGWVNDHIENSGGMYVGSNNETTMNLKEGEHEHAPKYPEETLTEKLLETRHNVLPEKTMIAKRNPFVKEAQAFQIRQINDWINAIRNYVGTPKVNSFALSFKKAYETLTGKPISLQQVINKPEVVAQEMMSVYQAKKQNPDIQHCGESQIQAKSNPFTKSAQWQVPLLENVAKMAVPILIDKAIDKFNEKPKECKKPQLKKTKKTKTNPFSKNAQLKINPKHLPKTPEEKIYDLLNNDESIREKYEIVKQWVENNFDEHVVIGHPDENYRTEERARLIQKRIADILENPKQLEQIITSFVNDPNGHSRTAKKKR